MPRSDYKLIRFLHGHHDEAALAWQATPLVLMPRDLLTYIREEHASIAEHAPTLDNLPWESAVLDLGSMDSEAKRAPGRLSPTTHTYTRFTGLPEALHQQETRSPWLRGVVVPEPPERWLVLETWRSANDRWAVWPDVVFINRDDPYDASQFRYSYHQVTCHQRAWGGLCNVAQCTRQTPEFGCLSHADSYELSVRLFVASIAYLTRTPTHPAEVARDLTPKQQRQSDKAVRAGKPWIREDLPHVVMLDLERAREYGHPSGTGDGSGASPRPHQRRGHWRRLRHPRFGKSRNVFVRPSWVGETEWSHEGVTYKVEQ